MPRTGQMRIANEKSGENSSELANLSRFSAALLSSRDLDQVLTQAVRHTRTILKARSCGIFLFDDKGVLRFRKGLGLGKRFQEAFDSRISPKLTKETLNRRYPRISNDALVGYKKDRSFRDLLRKEKIRKEIGIPLKAKSRLMGLLHIGRSSSYVDFSQKDLTLLTLLSAQIAAAISNAGRYQRLEKRSGVQEKLIEGVRDPAVLVDLKGNITYCNKAAEVLGGHGKEKLLGRQFSRLVSMEKKDISQILKSFKLLRSGRKASPFEIRGMDEGGRRRWIEVHLSRIKSKGRATGFQLTFRDITKCKGTEMALTRKERTATERARLLNDLRSLNQIDDILTRVCEAVRDSGLFERAVMTLHKPGGKITYLGQVGLPSSAVRRARHAPPIDDKLRSRITDRKFRVSDSFFVPAEAGLNYTKTKRYIPQEKSNLGSGNWRTGDELFVPLRYSPREVMGYLSADTPADGCRPDLKTIQALETLVEAGASRIREVEARDALERERDISRSILETANSLIVCLDADARITAFNQECERVTGYRRKEVLGKRWPELFLPPDERHARLKSFANWVRAHQHDRYEGHIVTKSGEILTMLWSNTSILGSGKKDVLAIAIGHDITDRKRAEEAVDKERQRLFSALEILPAYVYVQAPDYSIPFVNRKFRELFGDPGKRHCYEVFHGRREPCRECRTLRVLKTGVPQVYEWTSRDGRDYMVYEDIFPGTDGTEMVLEFGIDITEQKRAKEALQISRERYQLCTRAANVGVWDWNVKTSEFYIDPNVKEILGYKDEEIPNDIDIWMTYVHPEDRKPVMAAAQACLEGKTPEYVIEHRMLHKDGSVRWILSRGNVIRNGKANAVRMVGTDTDITERKRVEETLKESEQRLKAIFDNATDGILMLDPENRKYLTGNRMICQMLGYSLEEIKKLTVADIHPKQSLSDDLRTFEKVLKREIVLSENVPVKRKDDSVFYADINTFLVELGGKTYLMGIFRDITGRKRTEEALKKSEDQLRLITDALPVLISYIDSGQRYRFNNKAYEEWFGHSRSAIRGKHIKEVLGKPAYKSIKRYVQTVLSGQEVTFDMIVPYKDAGPRYVSATYIPHFGEGGEVKGFFTLVSDIAERKRAEQAVKESEERYRALFEGSAEGILIADVETKKFKYVNPALSQMLGYTIEELTAMGVVDIHPKDELDRVISEFEAQARGEKTLAQNIPCLRRDGTVIYADISSTNILVDGRECNIGFFRDVTERKLADEALRQSEERFRGIFENSPISLWEEDFSRVKKFLDGLRAKRVKDVGKYFENHPEAVARCAAMVKVLDVNNASLKLFKARSKQELQRSLATTFSEESYDAFREELMAISRGEKAFETEAITQTLNGVKKHVVIRWSVVPGYENTLAKVLVSVGDITELKKAREQNLLLETSKAVSRTLMLDQVLKIATEKMAEALKADRCAIALLEKSGDSMAFRYVFMKGDSPSPTLPRTWTPLNKHFSREKEILLSQGYLHIKNVETDALPAPLRSFFRKARIKSSLVVPLIAEKKLFGVFHIASVKKTRGFSSEEISLAQTIANQVGVAIQNTLLIEDLKKKHHQIEEQSKVLERQFQEQAILTKISQELSQTLDLDRVLQVATREAAEALQVDRCAVCLASPKEAWVEIRSIYAKGGKSVARPLGRKFYLSDYPLGRRMLRKKEAIVIPDVRRVSQKNDPGGYFGTVGVKSALVFPMLHGKKLVGVFSLSTSKKFKTFGSPEIRLGQTIANQVAVAVENARLLGLVKKSEEDLKALAAQLINVQEDKGKNIAQELHDEVGQMLFAMKLNLDVIKKNLPAELEKLEDLESRLGDTEGLLAQTIDYIRNLTTDLRPSMLDDFGLVPALKWHIDNFSKRTNVKVDLKAIHLKGRFPTEVETTSYRILQEALTNVAKHAEATEVTIRLARVDDSLSLSVEDNGKGFDTERTTLPKDRLGLFGIKERVKLLNGDFKIDSQPNKGTKLSVKIPLTERRV